ncbi:MAG: hypothetical protein A3D39_01200 [Candidatus Buchananbacteria bacterium RIFCSPHIGHO2_02_FULL_39_17]|nr:MAG: hypothetical protein A3D39_01200 [Candidatus Buchananbacteria bacterium RIFCSPHIGHO2_02_FULL_39_17]
MDHESTNNHFLIRISPKIGFLLGLGGAVVIMFIIGFFVLLGIVLKQENNGLSTRQSSTNVSGAAAGPIAPAQTAPTARVGAMAPITDQDWIRGNRNAKISIVEYSDLECPFCKRHHPTMQKLIAEYGDQVNWVYRHFPLTSLHPKAPKEAEATECAGEQGSNDAFWKYVDRLFEITPANNGLDPAELPKIAEYIGLNKTKFDECLNSGKYAAKVQAHAQDAVAAGGTGTPYNVIVAGDQKIPVNGAVPFEQFKAVIDPLLK